MAPALTCDSMTRVRVWIGELRFADDVEHKIRVKHSITRAEVEDALLYTYARNARWHQHPEYGERLIIRATARGSNKMMICYLAPIDEANGIWACRTAMWDA